MKRRRQNTASKLRRDCGYHIKDQPCFCVSQSNLLTVIYEKESGFIQVGNEEGQNNVNGKESIYDVISD